MYIYTANLNYRCAMFIGKIMMMNHDEASGFFAVRKSPLPILDRLQNKDMLAG